MKTLPLTFAAVLLSAGLLALACLPEANYSETPKSWAGISVDADRHKPLVFNRAPVKTPCFSPVIIVDADRLLALSSVPRGLPVEPPDDPPPAPPWTLYASWACEELREALEADNWRECRACLRRAWWDAEAAWGRLCGKGVH